MIEGRGGITKDSNIKIEYIIYTHIHIYVCVCVVY